MTSKVVYNGDLRTTATHLRSGSQIVTDAPTDNNGKGAAFSPTDLAATALASCALTIMGIFARNHGLNMDGATAMVTKVMAENPRRIGRVDIRFVMPPHAFTDKDKKSLEKAALTCPVALSLHPDIEQNITFEWS